jgi:hypothetical protein
VPYAYYARLKPRQKAVYRKSDAVTELPLPEAWRLGPAVAALREALVSEDRAAVAAAAKALCDGVLTRLALPPVRVRVLAARPSHHWGELHGQYEPGAERRSARVTVWMRTARHKRVVAFRTFLRTLLHEICHHIDYELLELEDSFHTEGFFKRESSLFKQLMA